MIDAYDHHHIESIRKLFQNVTLHFVKHIDFAKKYQFRRAYVSTSVAIQTFIRFDEPGNPTFRNKK